MYTLLTTFLAAFIGLGLYLYIAPDNLPAEIVNAGSDVVKGQSVAALSYYDHILGVIPNNVLAPFLSGNVLSVMLIAAAVGLALAFMPKTENREALLKSFRAFRNWHSPLSVLSFMFCRLVSLLSQASFPHRLKQA